MREGPGRRMPTEGPSAVRGSDIIRTAKDICSVRPATYRPAVASCELTVLNVVLSCEPRELTTAIIATEMPAAIRPYSMAVAPDSSLIKRSISLTVGQLLVIFGAHFGQFGR
jgi:hypothetical protein